MARTSPARICAAQFSSVVVILGAPQLADGFEFELRVYPEWLTPRGIFAGRTRGGRASDVCRPAHVLRAGFASAMLFVGFDDALDEIVASDVVLVEIDHGD